MTISTPTIVFNTLEIVANSNSFTPQYYQITWDTTVATYIQVEVLEGAPFEVALKEGGVYSSRCILQREGLRRGMMTHTIRVRPTQMLTENATGVIRHTPQNSDVCEDVVIRFEGGTQARPAPKVPTLQVSPNRIDFGKLKPNEQTSKTIALDTTHFTGNVALSVSPPFQISLDGITKSDKMVVNFNANTSHQAVYVHFSASNEQIYRGELSIDSQAAALSSRVQLVGECHEPKPTPIWIWGVLVGLLLLGVCWQMGCFKPKPEPIIQQPSVVKPTTPNNNETVPNNNENTPNVNLPSPQVDTDKDGDGVKDADDECPELKGRKSNHGCP